MHQLEEAASGILKSMFSEKVTIHLPMGEDPTRLLLARWAFKTALMIQSTNNQSVAPDAVFHQFYQEQRPPRRSVIYIARHKMGMMPNGAHSVAWDIDLAAHYTGVMYGVTFFINNIVMQVVGYHLDTPATSVAPDLVFPQTFSQYVQRLWPAGYVVVWPPDQPSFTDQDLVRFGAELALIQPAMFGARP